MNDNLSEVSDMQKQQERLWDAAVAGNCAEIRRSVISGADINMVDEEGRSAFQMASQCNQVDAMRTILAVKELIDMEKMGFSKDEMYSVNSEEKIQTEEAGVLDRIGRKFFGKKSA